MTDSKCMILALIGANGMLAQAVKKTASPAYEVVSFDLPAFDLTDRVQVLSAMAALQPAVIVNCAAFTNVDGCESEEALATRVNGEGPAHLAEAAKRCGATLVHVSTDYVFSGDKGTPYVETDPVAPRSAYGRSKLTGEEAVRSSGLERYFIVRTSWLYGPGGRNFVETIARLAAEREELRVVADQVGSPTYTEDLAAAIFNLLGTVTLDESDPEKKDLPRAPGLGSALFGTYHFSNSGICSWHEFAVAIVEELRRGGGTVKAQRMLPIRTEEYPLPAKRPAWSVLSKEKYVAATGAEVPEWRDALKRYFQIR